MFVCSYMYVSLVFVCSYVCMYMPLVFVCARCVMPIDFAP